MSSYNKMKLRLGSITRNVKLELGRGRKRVAKHEISKVDVAEITTE